MIITLLQQLSRFDAIDIRIAEVALSYIMAVALWYDPQFFVLIFDHLLCSF